MPKKIPMRQCLGCREMKPKKELTRVVRAPDGTVSIDSRGKSPGRGRDLAGLQGQKARPRRLRLPQHDLPAKGAAL